MITGAIIAGEGLHPRELPPSPRRGPWPAPRRLADDRLTIREDAGYVGAAELGVPVGTCPDGVPILGDAHHPGSCAARPSPVAMAASPPVPLPAALRQSIDPSR